MGSHLALLPDPVFKGKLYKLESAHAGKRKQWFEELQGLIGHLGGKQFSVLQ